LDVHVSVHQKQMAPGLSKESRQALDSIARTLSRFDAIDIH
jgi:hypothetical protein